MGMFDNYTNLDGYIPDNRHIKCEDEQQDEIVIGGTALHTFKLYFLASEVCRSQEWAEVVYKQGTEILYVFGLSELDVVENPTKHTTVITVKMSPDMTQIFNPHRETFAQLKLYLNSANNNEVIFGDKNHIKVTDTLENTF